MLNIERPTEELPRESYTYYPHTSPVPEAVAVSVRGRSYKIIANIEITDPNCSGVIFAHGSSFGGHSLFIKNKKLYYVYNFLGIKPEQVLVSGVLKPGKYSVGMEFIRDKAGEYKESLGQAKLYVNEQMVAEAPMRAQVGKFTLGGDGLCVGFDSEDPVSELYTTKNEFKGGTVHFVTINVDGKQYLDLEKEAQNLFSD